MKAYEKRIRAKFKRAEALQADGATKEHRKMSDHWTKRKPKSVAGFFDAKKARKGA